MSESHSPKPPASAVPTPSVPAPAPAPASKPAVSPPAEAKPKFNPLPLVVGLIAVILFTIFIGIPWVREALDTVSTDDAYVNGHVTFVAPRVAGQVLKVLVDDNQRVRKGTLLLQLDPKPYQVQVDIAQAAVDAAQSDLVVARAQVRSIAGQIRSQRYNMDRAVEDVHNQLSLLKSKIAFWESQKAVMDNAQLDYERAVPLVPAGAIAQQEVDHRKQAYLATKAQVEEALQAVYQVRVSLGLPPLPPQGQALDATPPDLDQTHSSVRQAMGSLIQAASQLGVTSAFDLTPKQLVEDFYKRDPQGNINTILEVILKDAPTVKQSEAKLLQTQRKLEEAKLNLSYCEVYAEIDGAVTKRSVNPGNNVIAGQSLMALRSVTDIWIDANFKETQLKDLKIGQPVDVYVDMYGNKEKFKGRVSGFTMGTGSTLAIFPAENATGNFVKVVQRLPVKIDLVNYDADKTPLFIGLSVRPVILIKEAPTGPAAGQTLQPYENSAPAPPTAPVQVSKP